MNMKEVKHKAKTLGVQPGRMNKTELVRKIQRVEGFTACYNTGVSSKCPQSACCFRGDCV